jgi:hypothetical protein
MTTVLQLRREVSPRHENARGSGEQAILADTHGMTDPQIRSRGDTCRCGRCPSADASDREAARVVATYPEQGWSLLCNGVVLFEDTGELLPDGRAIAPHRPAVAAHPPSIAA